MSKKIDFPTETRFPYNPHRTRSFYVRTVIWHFYVTVCTSLKCCFDRHVFLVPIRSYVNKSAV
jgi:hypothetical protein